MVEDDDLSLRTVGPEVSMLLKVYGRLLAYFGPQGWWPEESAFEVLVGAILAQRTTWRNASRAMESLKRAGLLDPASIASAAVEEIARLIRSAGLYRQKAERLREISCILVDECGGSLERAFAGVSTEVIRRRLLSWRGVGPETADSVLLYGARRLAFPVDIYTVRFAERLGLGDGGYSELQSLFMSQLPADLEIYREFHALIDELGNRFCRTTPRCASCPLRDVCCHAASR